MENRAETPISSVNFLEVPQAKLIIQKAFYLFAWKPTPPGGRGRAVTESLKDRYSRVKNLTRSPPGSPRGQHGPSPPPTGEGQRPKGQKTDGH